MTYYKSLLTIAKMSAKEKAKKIVDRMVNGWTKWGGGNRGILKDNNPTWACQSCGVEQMHEYPTFIVDFPDVPVMRICAHCKNKMVVERIDEYFELIKHTRKNR